MNKYFCLVLFLTGCATYYVPPTKDKPLAYVSYEVLGDPILGYTAELSHVVTPTSSSCPSKKNRMVWINNGNPFGGSTTESNNIPILAQDSFTVFAGVYPPNLYGQNPCRHGLTFKPEINKHYLVSILWKGSCSSAVYEINDGSKRLIDFQKAEYYGCR